LSNPKNNTHPTFSITYDGKEAEIDARTLIQSLDSVQNIVRELSYAESLAEQFTLKVRANRPGSFVVDLVISPEFIETAKSLFSGDNYKIAGAIIGLLAGILELRKHLKKEPPKSVTQNKSSVTVENSKGENITVNNNTYNYYVNNHNIQANLDRNYTSLASDNTISSFKLTDENSEQLFNATRDDFPDMVIGKRIDPEENRYLPERVILNIVKPSFERGYKWKFIYRGVHIGATVEDEEFLNKVDQRTVRFAKGDLMDVDLQILQEYDKSLSTYVNKNYVVQRVHNHMTHNPQSGFGFNEGKGE